MKRPVRPAEFLLAPLFTIIFNYPPRGELISLLYLAGE